jgi:crossover junction endodeoxyribonuclease RusA
MVKLSLPVTPSVNAMYRNVPKKGRVKSRVYRDWLRDADAHFLMQKRRIASVEGEYEVAIKLPKATRGDVDNRTKAVLDFMVSRGITADDRHCRKVSTERALDTWLCEVIVTAAVEKPIASVSATGVA